MKPLDRPGGFAGTVPAAPFEPLTTRWSALGWALVVVGCGGAALGCGDLRKASQSIAREEPSLSLGADNRQGEGPAQPAPAPAPAPAKPEKPVAAVADAPDDGVAADDEDAEEVAEASPTTRRRASRSPSRRRRAASADRGNAEPADHAGDGAAGDAAPGAYKVSRLVVARGVSGREPVGVGRSFAASDVDKIHAFIELTNEARVPGEIVVTFTSPSGGAAQSIKLNVGAERRWRTWAATRKARAAGTWAVAVTDGSGAEIGRTSFTLTK